MPRHLAPEVGEMRFHAIMNDANEPQGMAFMDWFPLDAATWERSICYSPGEWLTSMHELAQRRRRQSDMTAWIFGVDIGRVLVDEDESTGSKGLLNEEYLKAPPLNGAFEEVAELAHLAGGRVYLVSRCGERVEQRTRRWLEHTGFWRKTGLDAAHLHFVRASHQKAPIVHKLGVNCFVDDSLRVLKCLDSVAELIYFRPDARGRAVVEDPSREDDTRFVEWRNRITMVDGWGEVLATVRGGQSAEDAPDPDCRILRPLRRENRIERSK